MKFIYVAIVFIFKFIIAILLFLKGENLYITMMFVRHSCVFMWMFG